MKLNITKLLSLLTIVFLTLAIFTSCKVADNKDVPSSSTGKSAAESRSDGTSVDSSAGSPAKYENAEVYENANGNKAAKTESGEEVELTGESLSELYAQYEKVRGTGNHEEKELLDKLQLILEAPKN